MNNEFGSFDEEPFDLTDEVDKQTSSPRIYFSSSTHPQLSQSINEFKKINYNNDSAVVLAGRDSLCINQDVQKLDNIGAKNQACKFKTKGENCIECCVKEMTNICQFYSNLNKNQIDEFKNISEMDLISLNEMILKLRAYLS